MKYRLTKIKSLNDKSKEIQPSDSFIGVPESDPVVGKNLIFLYGFHQGIATSKVESIITDEQGNKTITTKNSLYKLEIIGTSISTSLSKVKQDSIHQKLC
jgi:hypothetical protein